MSAADLTEWERLAESRSLSAFDTIERATRFPDVVAEVHRLRDGLNLILDGAAGCYGKENMPSCIGDVLTEVHALLAPRETKD